MNMETRTWERAAAAGEEAAPTIARNEFSERRDAIQLHQLQAQGLIGAFDLLWADLQRDTDKREERLRACHFLAREIRDHGDRIETLTSDLHAACGGKLWP